MTGKSHQAKAFPVGLFILLSMVVLIVGVIWIRNITMQPGYRFIAQYWAPDPIAEGVAVYYRGVKVGRVTQVALAPNHNSTYVTIGIDDENLRLAENVRIEIKLEGITGQRYIQINPPWDERLSDEYIDPGEIVEGTPDYTLERLRMQLARIAEEGTLEKILKSTQETMQELEVASTDLRSLANQADTFLSETRAPTQNAIRSFEQASKTAERFLAQNEPGASQAIRNFSQASHEFGLTAAQVREFTVGAEGTINQSLPKLAAGFESLGQNTRGLNDAIFSVRNAADRFGETFTTINTQLVETDLIPRISGTATSITGGIGHFTGKQPPELAELTDMLTRLEETSVSTASVLEQIEPDTRTEQARLARMDNLVSEARQMVRVVQPVLKESADADALRQQVSYVSLLSAQLSRAANNLAPELRGEIPGTGPASMQNNWRLLAEKARQFGQTASRVQSQAIFIQPRLEEIAAQAREQRKEGGLDNIFGGLDNIGKAAERVDCVTTQVGHILDQRFLGFRLFFGNPSGDKFDGCKSLVDYPGKDAYETTPAP